jgi:hypothetical protein
VRGCEGEKLGQAHVLDRLLGREHESGRIRWLSGLDHPQREHPALHRIDGFVQRRADRTTRQPHGFALDRCA